MRLEEESHFQGCPGETELHVPSELARYLCTRIYVGELEVPIQGIHLCIHLT